MVRSVFTTSFTSVRKRRFNAASRAVILLEVVLAMSLFAVTVAVIWSAVSSSQLSIRKMAIKAHLNDLAVSRMNEIHAGILEPVEMPETFYEQVEFAEYSWSLTITPLDNLDEYVRDEMQVIVTLRHQPSGLTRKLAENIVFAEDAP